jgi:hypothetical protein
MRPTISVFFVVAPLFFVSILVAGALTNPAFTVIPSALAQTNETDEGIDYLGVAMRGYYTSEKQDGKGTTFNVPSNYYNDSLKLISQAGMNHIRYSFYWESYVANPSLFLQELESFANKADQYGLKVLYDNHQWHTSSWLESRGTGFPHFLFDSNPLYVRDSGGNTDSETAKAWWTNWWNRSVFSANGTDGWTLQANFLKEIVNLLDRHPSTLGYEILSEPQVHSNDQWEKVGQFNTFMVNELRNVTSKTLAYSQQVPAGINEPTIDVVSENMATMAPANKENVIYKVSLYGVPTEEYQSQRLSILAEAARLAGVPLYIGEWNNVDRVQSGNVDVIDPTISNITPEDIDIFLATFEDLRVWGAAYWLWNFKPSQTPNFNLITVDDQGQIIPTQYYEMLKGGIAKVSPNPSP